MLIFIFWIVTVLIAYIISCTVIKIDYKYNNADMVEEIDFADATMLLLIFLLIPVMNILVAILLAVFLAISLLEGKNVGSQDILEKVFFIKDKNKY